MPLSQSLEDYLEGIYILIQQKKVARVKDLSEHLSVSTPSVVSAIKSLVGKKLVRHEHYGYIELTSEGEKLAGQLYDKHRILSSFFQKVLGVRREIAEVDACSLEHHIHPETFEKVVSFFEFLETCPDPEPAFIMNFHAFLKTGARGGCPKGRLRRGQVNRIPTVKLSQLKVGQKSRVVRLEADKRIRKHLLALGLVRGEVIEVVRKAPLGDPIDYKIKDYHLSLRKVEADMIMVEKLKK